jgi:DNA polymerase III alpha subunit (gram-positive type)
VIQDNAKQDLYFSVDIETTGLIPVKHSILSLGACAIRDDEIFGQFERNILPQPGTVMDGEDGSNVEAGFDTTKAFWDKFPAAFAATQVNQVPVKQAFQEFGSWVKELVRPNEYPIFLAYPATFDFTFCSVLCNLYCPEAWPFGFAAFDMQSYAAALLNVPFSQARAKNWPKEWTKVAGRHEHIALSDAIGQAKSFIAMRKWAKERFMADKEILLDSWEEIKGKIKI